MDVSRMAVLFIVLFVVGLVGGGATSWIRHEREPLSSGGGGVPASTPASAEPTPTALTSTPTSPSASPSSSSPSPSISATPSQQQRELAARARLEVIANRGLARADPHGQWVAQLSSKYIGIVDPRQKSANGSHTFYAVDILAEHQAIVEKIGSGATVVLVKGPDIKKGRQQTDGKVFWYTFALGDFDAKSEAEHLCRDVYPGLSDTALDNRCIATQLNP